MPGGTTGCSRSSMIWLSHSCPAICFMRVTIAWMKISATCTGRAWRPLAALRPPTVSPFLTAHDCLGLSFAAARQTDDAEFTITDETKPLRICKHCDKAFVLGHPNAVFLLSALQKPVQRLQGPGKEEGDGRKLCIAKNRRLVPPAEQISPFCITGTFGFLTCVFRTIDLPSPKRDLRMPI